ncbi:TolC family protein [Aurantiacibacter aquimixticola]|uniref:TolC family protein n=1 Tax=Aurantiacibacter aquimixticola TaxID=1958945 RepID=A0A419RTI8_9SPHN|nr:TolC family protein [Aurantiacibacter aquimixticola]RJY09096.1 TolC family protein [Aurantiacibacter aquimixticola]
MKKLVAVSFVTAVALAVSSPSAAQTLPQSLCPGIAQTIQLTLSRDPRLLGSDAQIAAAQAQYKIERSAGRPQISAFARSGLGDGGQLLNAQSDNEAGVQLRQILFDFGRISAATRAARADIEVAAFDRQSVERDVALQAAFAFFDLAEAVDLIVLAERQALIFSEDAELAQRALENQLITGGAAAQIVAGSATAENDRLLAELAATSARSELLSLTGLDYRCPRNLPLRDVQTPGPSQRFPSALALLEHLQLGAPQLLSARAAISAQRARVAEAARDRFPELDLGAFASARYNEDLDEVVERNRVGVTLTIPIYQGGQFSARRELEEARLASAEADLGSVERALTEQVVRAYREIELQREILAQLDVAGRALEEQLSFARLSFERNIALYDEISRAADALGRNRRLYIQTEYALRRNLAFLESADGTLAGL